MDTSKIKTAARKALIAADPYYSWPEQQQPLPHGDGYSIDYLTRSLHGAGVTTQERGNRKTGSKRLPKAYK